MMRMVFWWMSMTLLVGVTSSAVRAQSAERALARANFDACSNTEIDRARIALVVHPGGAWSLALDVVQGEEMAGVTDAFRSCVESALRQSLPERFARSRAARVVVRIWNRPLGTALSPCPAGMMLCSRDGSPERCRSVRACGEE